MKRLLVPAILVLIGVAAIVTVVALQPGKPQPQKPDNYLRDIQARGVLRVGIDPTYAPFDTIENGQVGGYDARLCREIAAAIGVRVEFVPMSLDTLYDGLAAGKVDMLASALPFIYERQKDVRYSEPYYQAGEMLVVRAEDTSITSAAKLAGKRVAVELGSGADTEARRLARTSVPGMDVLSTYHSANEALDALVAGSADASITDNTSAEEYARAHPGKVKIVLPPVTDEPYVIAVPVRAESLAQRVNATIESLRASGKLAELMR